MFGASITPDAEAPTHCSYAGPPANVMTVTVRSAGFLDFGVGVIRRRGLEITANEFAEPRKPCSGGTPTVLNTDTIRVLLRGDASAEVRLSGGPFAPGASAEAEGAPEIEIEFRGN